MSLPPARLWNPSKDKHLIPQMAQIHHDIVMIDHQMATFLPPLEDQKLTDFWHNMSDRQERDEVAIIIQMTKGSDGFDDEGEVAGFVVLVMHKMETGPFRADVKKLMVSTRCRKMGVARRVMEKLEDVAREKRAELLMLDTTIGLPADQVYPKLGYHEVGVIPKFGISPLDGSLRDERFYYKDLRDE